MALKCMKSRQGNCCWCRLVIYVLARSWNLTCWVNDLEVVVDDSRAYNNLSLTFDVLCGWCLRMVSKDDVVTPVIVLNINIIFVSLRAGCETVPNQPTDKPTGQPHVKPTKQWKAQNMDRARPERHANHASTPSERKQTNHTKQSKTNQPKQASKPTYVTESIAPDEKRATSVKKTTKNANEQKWN